MPNVIFVLIAWLLFSSAAIAFPSVQSSFENERFLHKVAIIGSDDRSYDLSRYSKLESGIGVIFSVSPTEKWACSSFCVADNVIATNAHCVYQNKGTNLSEVHFGFPTGFGNRAVVRLASPLNYASPKNIRISVLSGRYRRNQSVSEQKNDWALAQLSLPICKNRTLRLANRSTRDLMKAGRQNKIFMIGFHMDDRMTLRRLSDNCRIYSSSNRRYFPYSVRKRLRRNSNLIGHTCDGQLGSSGSPIFMRTRSGYQVIAINSGEFRLSKYRVRQDPYSGRIYGPRQLVYKRTINVGVHTRAFIDDVNYFSNVRLLNGVEEFKELQSLLKKLNYYRGPVDGLHGPGTRKAILQFEKDQSLPHVGFPTRQLLEKLRLEIKADERRITLSQ